MSKSEILGDVFEATMPQLARSEVEKLVPRRFAEFVCFLAQHRNNYASDPEYKPYDKLCKKHKATRQIANYLLAAAHNNAKPNAAQVRHLFDIPEATTYKVTKALREIGYITNCWKPLRPLVELNKKRTEAFFDSPVFYMFIVASMSYYIVRRARIIEAKFSVGYWLNLFDEKPNPLTNPVTDWNFYPKTDSHEESEKE
tara:strand:+ start:98 stop:694 length:597 start_codon:yes stop_codon:yes gene_type:complete